MDKIGNCPMSNKYALLKRSGSIYTMDCYADI